MGRDYPRRDHVPCVVPSLLGLDRRRGVGRARGDLHDDCCTTMPNTDAKPSCLEAVL